MKQILIAALLAVSFSFVSSAHACEGQGCGKAAEGCSAKSHCGEPAEGCSAKSNCGKEEKSCGGGKHACCGEKAKADKTGFTIAKGKKCEGDVDCCCWGNECLGANKECCAKAACGK